MKNLLIIMAVAGLSTGVAGQTTWYVDDDNCPGPGTGAEADPLCSIQDGIDAASDGDEIIVRPGTYEEFIRMSGATLSLRSSGGPTVTTIHAPTDGEIVVVCDSGEGPDTVIEGFTITGGLGSFDNESWPGGMLISGSSPTVRNCVLAGNRAGGGSCFTGWGGGLACVDASPLVDDCLFVGNLAEGHFCGGFGGGVYVSGGSPSFVDCTFAANIVVGSYGAGAGLYIENASNVLVEACSFLNNVAEIWSDGGGARIVSSSIVIRGCTFSGNVSEEGTGGGLSMSMCDATIVDCVFVGNDAIAAGGNQRGGGLDLSSCSPLIVNCVFRANVAAYGGGLAATNGSPFIVNCTVEGNQATQSGGGLSGDGAALDLLIANSILWSNVPDQIDGSVTVAYSDVMDGWPGTGNVVGDPLFVAPTDLRLQPGSPCVDGGSAALLPPDTADLDGDGDTDEPLPLDLDGNPRVVGANVDMGTYEFQGAPCPADLDGDGVVGVTDLTAVILAWGTPDGDVTGDGTTDVQDLVAVTSAWGRCE